ncbi:MAG: CBS domain-containing protein [Acidobacteria bacterium]|nr:CBS domain-containing protein [Acidobacteriota bacterium]
MRSIRELIEGRKLFTIKETSNILDAARLMVKRKIGALPVTNQQGNIIGIFTERDLLKRVVASELDVKNTLVSQVMTTKLVMASADETPMYCLRKMKEKKFRHMLIAEGKQIIGIVSQRDLIEVDLERKTNALRSIDD